jgi:hypothetical protein
VHELITIIQEYEERGNTELQFHITDHETKANLRVLSSKYKISLSKKLISYLDKSTTMTYSIN